MLELDAEPNIIESCKTGKKVKEIDLPYKTKLLSLEKFNLGFAVEDVIKNLKRRNAVTTSQIKDFSKEAKQFIISVLPKVLGGSPLGSLVLRSASVFDPPVISELSIRHLQERFNRLLKYFIELDILAPNRCDQAMSEFSSLLDSELKNMQVDFLGFDTQENWLDHF